MTTLNPVPTGIPDDAAEREQARRLAERYRCPFVDLREQRIDPELFRSIPAEMMFRYKFVPLESHNGTLVVAVADPSQLQQTDELALLLNKRLQIKVATTSQIDDLLKRTEASLPNRTATAQQHHRRRSHLGHEGPHPGAV